MSYFSEAFSSMHNEQYRAQLMVVNIGTRASETAPLVPLLDSATQRPRAGKRSLALA